MTGILLNLHLQKLQSSEVCTTQMTNSDQHWNTLQVIDLHLCHHSFVLCILEEEQADRALPFTGRTHLTLNSSTQNECLQASLSVESDGKDLLTDTRNWKQVNSIPEIRYNDKLNSYYVKKEFNCSPKGLFEASWKDNTKWNNQVKHAFVLNTINESTELVRIISQPAMNGYIASRYLSS